MGGPPSNRERLVRRFVGSLAPWGPHLGPRIERVVCQASPGHVPSCNPKLATQSQAQTKLLRGTDMAGIQITQAFSFVTIDASAHLSEANMALALAELLTERSQRAASEHLRACAEYQQKLAGIQARQ